MLRSTRLWSGGARRLGRCPNGSRWCSRRKGVRRVRRRTGTGQSGTDRRICRDSNSRPQLSRGRLLYSQYRMQSQYRFAPARGAQSRGTNEASVLAECRGGGSRRKTCRGNGGRVGGACGQGIDGEGPKPSAPGSPHLAVESQRGRRVLSCEGPASTMGLLAWDCEACGRHGASGTRAGAAAAGRGTPSRSDDVRLRRAVALSNPTRVRRLDLATLDLAPLSVWWRCWCPSREQFGASLEACNVPSFAADQRRK